MKNVYADEVRVAVKRMPASLRRRAYRDLRTLIARAPSIPDVRELARDTRADPEVRARAIWALGVLPRSAATELFLLILSEQTAATVVLWEAGKALVQHGVPGSAVPLLLRMLRDGTVEQRKVAAWALGMGSRSGAARTALESTVTNTNEHPDVRCHAAEALGGLARKASTKALLETLSDAEPRVRFWSAYALGEIGDPRAVQRLQEMAGDENHIEGFHSVGAEARSAVARIAHQQNDTTGKKQRVGRSRR